MSCFTRFSAPVDAYELPRKFTFPFNYEPHPLCRLAAHELQQHLLAQTAWQHDFGIEQRVEGTNIGKMFGVMVVRNQQGELGYLAAFSGKLAGVNHLPGFVPPVFDLLQPGGFYRRGEDEISAINHRIRQLEESDGYQASAEIYQELCSRSTAELEQYRTAMKAAKQSRDLVRRQLSGKIPPDEMNKLEQGLQNESMKWQYDQKHLARQWKARLEEAKQELDGFTSEINRLKEERRARSASLQQKMFEQYRFLDSRGQWKGVVEIFEHTDQKVPPAGAGDCAGPKMLQYAYLHGMQPLAMAEFWWGQSPSSEIRRHGCFYPSCRGKCEPILGHMLGGLEVDDNPITQQTRHDDELDIVYEDEAIAVVNKPAEFLSVPGKVSAPSVYSLARKCFPGAEGPIMVHRLDMSTSGLLVLAKTSEAYHHLQDQFLHRGVEKRYVALLKGYVAGDEGVVDLPLRVDLDNRPRQLVCYQHGKQARTRWQVVERKDGYTRVYFFPLTGRTHQLRVHAAHSLGLNCPIVGDDLYGERADRLHLHAQRIEFTHPVTGKRVYFEVDARF